MSYQIKQHLFEGLYRLHNDHHGQDLAQYSDIYSLLWQQLSHYFVINDHDVQDPQRWAIVKQLLTHPNTTTSVTSCQLRFKQMSFTLKMHYGKIIKQLCEQNNILLIVNDDLLFCQKIDADGLHSGFNDQVYPSVRGLLKPHQIIGISASTKEEIILASYQNPDYIGIGAVNSTSTKQGAVIFEDYAFLQTAEKFINPAEDIWHNQHFNWTKYQSHTYYHLAQAKSTVKEQWNLAPFLFIGGLDPRDLAKEIPTVTNNDISNNQPIDVPTLLTHFRNNPRFLGFAFSSLLIAQQTKLARF